MKKFFLFLVLILAHHLANSQKPQLSDEWTAIEYKLRDGSPIYDPEVLNKTFLINFLDDKNLIYCYNGMCQKVIYSYQNNILKFNDSSFLIIKNSEGEMDLIPNQIDAENNSYLIKMVLKKINDLSFTPNYYIAKNKEEVYESIPGLLEPYFMNENKNAINFILSKFNFPLYKNGGFVVRFIVSKEGTLHGVKVIASTNNDWNDQLVSAVYKTKYLWNAGTYNGKKVNIEVEYNFDLGYSKQSQFPVDSLTLANTFLMEAKSYHNFSPKSKELERILNQTITYDPFKIEAYYMLSDYYFETQQKEKACSNLKTLIGLNQKKAKAIYSKKCD